MEESNHDLAQPSVRGSLRSRVGPEFSSLTVEFPVGPPEIDRPVSYWSDGNVFGNPLWFSPLVNDYSQPSIPGDTAVDRFAVAANNCRPFSYWNAEYEYMRSLISGNILPLKSTSYCDGGESLSWIHSTLTFPYSHQPYNSHRSGYSNMCSHGSPTVYHLLGEMATMAKEKDGSCVLMEVLEGVKNEFEVDLVLNELLGNIGTFTQDLHGSCVVQKLIRIGSDKQITTILLGFMEKDGEFVKACLTMKGVLVAKELLNRIDVSDTTQSIIAVELLTSSVVTLAKSPNGHDVIQHCLKYLPSEFKEKILSALADRCEELATDPYGYRVLKQCVNEAQGSVKDFLLSLIILNAVYFSLHPFGSNVVKHILNQRMPIEITAVLKNLLGSFAALSVNKYGSDIVEKFLQDSDEHQVDAIIAELLEISDLTTVFENEYGNYVVQVALEASTGRTREALIDAIRLNSSSMRHNIYGNKVLSWLENKELL